MKKVAVIGLGKSGLSAAHFLQNEGYSVWATDDKVTCAPDGVILKNAVELTCQVQDFEFVVISPGVPLSHPLAKQAKLCQVELFCDVELAFRKIADKQIPIVGITGSNGKTTTTSLTCHILNSCNIPAKAVGNIGTPMLSVVDDVKGTLVAELSSFQLETMATKVLDAAIILNITPNHLDRHGTMEEYIKAKERIEHCLRPEGVLWIQKATNLVKNGCYFGFDSSCDLYTDTVAVYRFGKKESELPDLLKNSKSHNVENYLAAYALARHYGADPEECRKSYEKFEKPKHRLQHVHTCNEIMFYNDSKATSVDAVLRAVESISNPIVLIAGGVHKGYPYSSWKSAFKGKVRACVLIGQAADCIEQDLDCVVPILRATSLSEAVEMAISVASPQDAVLLSPGCASYDMFTSYEERGDKFQDIVCSLK